jgi:hypothetical protein
MHHPHAFPASSTSKAHVKKTHAPVILARAPRRSRTGMLLAALLFLAGVFVVFDSSDNDSHENNPIVPFVPPADEAAPAAEPEAAPAAEPEAAPAAEPEAAPAAEPEAAPAAEPESGGESNGEEDPVPNEQSSSWSNDLEPEYFLVAPPTPAEVMIQNGCPLAAENITGVPGVSCACQGDTVWVGGTCTLCPASRVPVSATVQYVNYSGTEMEIGDTCRCPDLSIQNLDNFCACMPSNGEPRVWNGTIEQCESCPDDTTPYSGLASLVGQIVTGDALCVPNGISP